MIEATSHSAGASRVDGLEVPSYPEQRYSVLIADVGLNVFDFVSADATFEPSEACQARRLRRVLRIVCLRGAQAGAVELPRD